MSRPALIEPHQYVELARLHVAGWTDGRIAGALGGCHRSTVTRARKLPAVRELIAAERKREQARLRQAAKRRDRAAAQPAPVVTTEPVPASFEDGPGFGFGPPGSPRLTSPEGACERTGPGRGHSDDPSQNEPTPGRPDRSSRQPAAEQASLPEIADAQAAAAAAACYVEQLEAAYQQAFAAIATLATAIERVQQLRGQEQVWEQAYTLGVAPNRPEPWHVRAAFDDGFRQLQKRLNQALNSSW